MDKAKTNWHFHPVRIIGGFFVVIALLAAASAYASDAKNPGPSNQRVYDLVAGTRMEPRQLLSVRWILYHGKRLPGKEGVFGSDDDFEQLAGALQLESIKLGPLASAPNFAVTAAGLKPLTQLQRLKRVQFSGMTQAKEKLEVLARIPNLEELVLTNSDVSNPSAKVFSQMKRLRHLDLEGAPIDTTFFQHSAFPPTLTHLRLDATQVDSRVIRHLPKSLTHLSLIATEVDEALIGQVSRLDQLQVLEITGLSRAALHKIEANNPSLKINPRAIESF